jgi:hypothetical protein
MVDRLFAALQAIDEPPRPTGGSKRPALRHALQAKRASLRPAVVSVATNPTDRALDAVEHAIAHDAVLPPVMLQAYATVALDLLEGLRRVETRLAEARQGLCALVVEPPSEVRRHRPRVSSEGRRRGGAKAPKLVLVKGDRG